MAEKRRIEAEEKAAEKQVALEEAKAINKYQEKQAGIEDRLAQKADIESEIPTEDVAEDFAAEDIVAEPIDEKTEYDKHLATVGAFVNQNNVGKLNIVPEDLIDTKQLLKAIAGIMQYHIKQGSKTAREVILEARKALGNMANKLTNSEYQAAYIQAKAQHDSAQKVAKAQAKTKSALGKISKTSTTGNQPKKASSIILSAEQQAKELSSTIKSRRTKIQVIKHMGTEKARDWGIKKFQNNRAPIKKWQSQLERAGKIIAGGTDFNNIYDMIVMAFGRANHLQKQYMDAPIRKVQSAVDELVRVSGRSVEETLGWLHMYVEALHEPERRFVKFLLNVPLSLNKNISHNGTLISAADLREEIVDKIAKGVDKKTAQAYRKYIEWIATNYSDPTGFSPNGYKSTDKNSSQYNVIGGRTVDEIAQRKKDLTTDPFNKQIMEVINALKPVQKATIELNKQANYWTKGVQSVSDFYGFEHYVPFKGRPDSTSAKNVNQLELNSVRLSNDLKPLEGTFGGRESESQNPITQILVEGTLAVARAGRLGLTQAIKNAIKPPNGGTKILNGKIAKTYSFEERYKGLLDENLIKQRNVILNYNEDGSMDVIEIHDGELLEAIRRTYQESHPILDIVNSLTSFFGQTHTRLNPSFPILNFVRDVLTNAFVIAVEKSPGAASSFLGSIITKTIPNAMVIGKISVMYSNSNIKGIEALAAKNPYAKNVLEYLERGGQVSVVQGLSVQGQLDQLKLSLDKNSIAKTKEQIDKVFDFWTNSFELAARTAAYATIKSDELAKGKTEEQAKIKAVSYAKQLANFEEVGDWGKAMGAMFMFFRPSATGAVRSLESIAPMLRQWDSVLSSLPENITKDAKALATYKESFMKQRSSAMTVTAALTGMGAAAYMMSGMFSGDDDEERNKTFTDDMGRWSRYARFHFGEDNVIQIPWGFGLGAFAATGAQIAGMAVNPTVSVLDSASNIMNIALDSFIPLPVSRMSIVDNPQAWLIDSISPSIVRPFIEHTMNINGLGQHIYNAQSRMGDAYIAGDNVPDMYKDAAILLADATDGSIDISPNSMYFFANSYLDGISRIAHNGYGIGLTLSGEKEFDVKHDIPLFESFISNRSNIDARNFSKTQADVANAERKLNMFKTNPEKYMDYISKNPIEPTMVETFNKQVGGALKDFQEQAKYIRTNKDFSPKDKSEMLKENKIMQNMIKRQISEQMDYIKTYSED